MVNEVGRVRRAVRWRAPRRANNTVSLGEVLSELMDDRVSPRQTRAGLVDEAWSRLLPTELCRHCRIVDISGGRLKVFADSPSYMYELQLLSGEILKELAQRCPQARIREIKFAVG